MLKAVHRFNNCHRQCDESVAEHCFYVALYAFFLARHVELKDAKNLPCIPSIHYLTLFSRCLLHDLEESRSGDFPRNFKYSTPAVKESLDRAAAVAFGQVIEPLFEPVGISEKDDAERKECIAQWLHAKADDAEGRIVSLADVLSTLQYVWLEVQRGNKLILADVRDLPRNVEKQCSDDINRQLFGDALLDDVLAFSRELYHDA